MDEFELIDRIQPTYYQQPSLLRGIGDDAAVFRTMDDVVTATDTFVEGTHFLKETMTSYHIGWRALAANISDIAAMGATPKFYLVSMVIPDHQSDDCLLDIYRGMSDIASMFGVDLIGGDTVSGKELSLSVTIIGYVVRDKARYRHDARNGDIVFVSGTLGDSRAGLEILLKELQDNRYHPHFIHKHQLPMPQVDLGLLLQQIDRVALNDISDGIANEMHEIAVASDVTIMVDDAKIPVHPALDAFLPEQQFEWKYFGGEDFELVGTLSEHNWSIIQAAALDKQIKLTAIGKVMPKHKHNSHVLLQRNGTIEPLLKKGYTHLK